MFATQWHLSLSAQRWSSINLSTQRWSSVNPSAQRQLSVNLLHKVHDIFYDRPLS